MGPYGSLVRSRYSMLPGLNMGLGPRDCMIRSPAMVTPPTSGIAAGLEMLRFCNKDELKFSFEGFAVSPFHEDIPSDYSLTVVSVCQQC